MNYSRNPSHQIFSVSIKDISEYLNKSIKSEKQELQELRQQIPTQFHDFLPLFSSKEANKLPPHRYIDHEIPVEQDKKLALGPLYPISDEELKALREYLRENLEKDFIEPSTSSSVSPVLFVRKPRGGLRFCIDYRALNNITKKNLYPLPRIDDSLRQLLKAQKSTQLDLRGAYNQIRIKPADKPNTAFRTWYGLYNTKLCLLVLQMLQLLVSSLLTTFCENSLTYFFTDDSSEG
ncbi:hypothetical protein K3495_g7463 [Podosphaera aphanis]|nr:hypothetical protein K3495_g7463 [Podosphaera aphanis]